MLREIGLNLKTAEGSPNPSFEIAVSMWRTNKKDLLERVWDTGSSEPPLRGNIQVGMSGSSTYGLPAISYASLLCSFIA